MNFNSLFSTYGNTVFLSGADGWQSPHFKAFIQPLRYKNKLYQQGDYTPIGINKNDVYLYLGPDDHDLTKLNNTHRIHDSENNRYMIDRAEKIKFNDNTLYIWAIIRKTTEGSK
jgi:hypothetical protein